MASSIYSVEGDQVTGVVPNTDIDSEQQLQRMLSATPELLAGEQMLGSGLRFVLIEPELSIQPTGGERSPWRLDHLFIDQYGTPTLVEVKRSRDRRVRRYVVGQVLEYAANIRESLPPGKMRALFQKTCGSDAESEARLEHLLRSGEVPDGSSRSLSDRIEEFWAKAEAALSEHQIRLVFLADRLPQNLIRVIEFLNAQLERIEVVGVEVRQYRNDRLHILVPRVVGLTTGALEKRRRTDPERFPWDEESFMDAIQSECGQRAEDAVASLMEWCGANGAEVGFTTSKKGSFVPEIPLNGKMVWPVAVSVDGRVKLQLGHLASRGGGMEPLDAREELLRRLNDLLTEKIGLDRASAQPSFALAELTSAETLKGFLETMDWVKRQIQQG
jgi:hypothetical protein